VSTASQAAAAHDRSGDRALVTRLRRDLALTGMVKGALLLAGAAAIFAQAIPGLAFGGSVALAAVAGAWLLLSYLSARGSRAAAVTPALIAAGEYEQAEDSIEEALRGFSLLRSVKLRSLHHLALLRHAQRRWPESAMLCRALLAERLGILSSIGRSARLVLAEALLELDDLHGVHLALDGLYRQPLALGEALELTVLQLDYLSRIGQWQPMMEASRGKVELAELMPPAKSARAQALLALAARKLGLAEWEHWLRKRVELLTDRAELLAQRPLLADLWDGA
jgi:hypothetical protein